MQVGARANWEMQKALGHGRVRPAVAVRSDAASHAASSLTKTPSCGPVNPSAAAAACCVKVASEGNGGLDLRVSAGTSIVGGDSSSAVSICEWVRALAATSAASASHARPPVSQPGGQPASGPVNQSTRALACHPQSEMSGFDCRQSEAVQSLAQSSLTPVDGLTVQPPAAQIRHRLTLTPAKPSSFPSPPPSIHIVLDLNVAAIASRTTRSSAPSTSTNPFEFNTPQKISQHGRPSSAGPAEGRILCRPGSLLLSRLRRSHAILIDAADTDDFAAYKLTPYRSTRRYPALKKFEQTVPIPKAYAALGAFGIFTLFVFFNIAAGFLTNLLGFFVPAYFSLKALESPQPEDDVQWLTYWVVFGMFTFLETFSSIVLYYVPWYYTIKTLAIVWLMLPQTQGAKMVYSKVIRPAFLTTQKTVHKANASTPAAPAETH
ncbi:uncharacterized protein PAN0_009c3766 [Moesziomyces antarcticus]|uniref:Protein YOP1 n=1 Tax=Pseudozyma antarctica TaxID=84753 RepID=A0A081CFV3_PSEA2|nr:uncharacterized protein PAN0_009c3766 [Moesziomyces antarcticus]GAK65549.1 conserved hypothetical protein [Moesziomyces antarcticus]